MKLKSADIKLGLKTAFPPPGWRVFFEVGNDTGHKTARHANAVAMGIWPSNGHLIHGMEIKISRGDFLSEMRDPTKSQAVFQFCNRWSLVTPPGLVKVEELPEPWGLFTYDGKALRTVKAAPPLEPVPLTPGFVAAMLRRAGEQDDQVIDAALQRGREQAHAEFTRRNQQRDQRVNREQAMRETRAIEKLATYEKLFGELPHWRVEQLAPLVTTIQQIGVQSTKTSLVTTIGKLERAAELLRPIVEDIEQDDVFGELM